MVKQKKNRGENVDISTEVTVSTGTTANITIRRIFARNTKKMAFVQRTDVGTDIPNIVETGQEILKGAGTNRVSIYT